MSVRVGAAPGQVIEMTSIGREKVPWADAIGVTERAAEAITSDKSARQRRGRANFAGEGKGVTPIRWKGNFQLERKDKVEV
jgi:hypothetical protein